MTMKKTISTLVLAGAALFASGQQMTWNSQYMINHYVLNPGAAGTLDYMPIATSFRQQWAGFKDAPNKDRIPPAIHNTRLKPTDPAPSNTPFGEMKMPDPTNIIHAKLHHINFHRACTNLEWLCCLFY